MRALVLLVALASTAAACENRPERFPLNFDRMRDQPRYDAYGSSSYFADGKTMRTPPEGTVARENPAGTAAIVEGVANGAPVRQIPVPITDALMQEGRARYDVFCRPCHDVNGAADSPVAKNMQLRQPPSLLEPRIRQLPVGRIYQVIEMGYGLMPSYAHQLGVQDRWAVVAYVRALELRDGATLADLPAPVRQEAMQALASGGGR